MDEQKREEIAQLQEILKIIVPEEQAGTLASGLLKCFGRLEAVLEADADELVMIEGMTLRAAQWVSLLPALYRYCGREAYGSCPQLDALQTLGGYCRFLFAGKHFEQSSLLCMNARGKLIRTQMLQRGTLTESHLYLRQLVETALLTNASCVALTHNHPGGTMAPSSEDVQTTHLVGEAMRGIEVSLVDHIIVAGRKFLSLRQENVLPEKIWGGISAEKYFRNRSEKLTQRVEEQKGGTA